jgi:hypothetical protein
VSKLFIVSVIAAFGVAWGFGRYDHPQDDRAATRPDSRPTVVIPQPREKMVKPMRPPGPTLDEREAATRIRPFTDPAPDPQPDERFRRWAEATVPHLCQRFEVQPPRWHVEFGQPTVVSPRCTNASIYLLQHNAIIVYTNDRNGARLTVEQMMKSFLHAFMHHLEKSRGLQPAPAGHEPAFDNYLLQLLGLWRVGI